MSLTRFHLILIEKQAKADTAWSNPKRQRSVSWLPLFSQNITACLMLGFISSSKQQQAEADKAWSNPWRHRSVSWLPLFSQNITACHVLGFISSSKQQQAETDKAWQILDVRLPLGTCSVSFHLQNNNKPMLMSRGQTLNVTSLFLGNCYFLKTIPLAKCSVSFNLQNNNKPMLIRRGQTLNVTGLFHGYRYFLKTKPLAKCSVSFNVLKLINNS